MDRRIWAGALLGLLLHLPGSAAPAAPIASRQASMTSGVQAVFSPESGQPTVYGISMPFTFTKADAGKMLEIVAESPRPVTIELWTGAIPRTATEWAKGRKFLGNSGKDPSTKPTFKWMVEPGTYTALVVASLPAGEKPEPFIVSFGHEVREATEQDKAEWDKAVTTYDLGRIRALQAKRTPAPNFTGVATDHNPISLNQYRNKVVLLFFWSVQDPSAGEQFGFVQDLVKTYKDQGLEAIGINLDTDPNGINQAFSTYSPTWRQLFDDKTGNAAIADSYGVTNTLGTVLIDATGRIISRDQFGDALRKGVANALYENQLLEDALKASEKTAAADTARPANG